MAEIKRIAVPLALFILTACLHIHFQVDQLKFSDEAFYLSGIYEGERVMLTFGRHGFTYLLHPIWLVYESLSLPKSEFYKVIKYITVLLSSSSVVSWYLISRRISLDEATPAVSATWLMLSGIFVRSSSYVLPDTMMMCFALAAYHFFIKAHAENRRSLLFASGIFFGLSISVKELALPALLLIPLYLYPKEKRAFTPRAYAIFLTAIALIMLLGPLYSIQKEGDGYFRKVSLSMSTNPLKTTDLTDRITTTGGILDQSFPLYPLAFVGLWIMLKKRDKLEMSLIAPLLIYIPFITIYGNQNPRYLLMSLPALSFLCARSVTASQALFTPQARRTLGAISVLILVMLFSHAQIFPLEKYISGERRITEDTKSFADYLIQNHKKENVYVLEWRGGIIEYFSFPNNGIDASFIRIPIKGDPGYVNKMMKQSYRDDHVVIIASKELFGRQQDYQNYTRCLELENYGPELFRVSGIEKDC